MEISEGQKFADLAENCLLNLFSRWLDESEYEDVADYAVPLVPIAEECKVKIVKMLAKPFGVVYATDSGKTYQISVKKRTYGWKRIN